MSAQIMKLRINLILFAVSSIVLILYFTYARQNIVENPSSIIDSIGGQSESMVIKEVNKSATQGSSGTLYADAETTEDDNQIKWNPDNQVQKEQLLQWRAERGWHDMLNRGSNNAPDYRSYPQDVLEKLGDQGDVRALHELARLSISPAQRQQVLTKAAAYGSTFALFQLASVLSSEPRYEPNPTEERKRQAVIEALSYLEVARMRGEGAFVNGNVQEIQQMFQFSPTKSEVKLIETRTQEIYSDLAEQRRQIGLPEFDNSTPPVVKAFERYMQQ